MTILSERSGAGCFVTCVGGLPFLETEIKEESIQAVVQRHCGGKEWERGRRENCGWDVK